MTLALAVLLTLVFTLGFTLGRILGPSVAIKHQTLLDRESAGKVEFIYPQDAALKEAFEKGVIKNIDQTFT